ncbi:MAG: flavodoxin family protein [Clostridiaceae bacterium]
MRSLIVVHSWHHGNTAKVAEAMAQAIGADLKTPQTANAAELTGYDLIGFGAGIDSGAHYAELLEFAKSLPNAEAKKCFLFSTCGVYTESKMITDHAALRSILEGKGYRVLGDFSCVGFNTNSFLKHFGGMNKGRPNAEDLARAKTFVRQIAGCAVGGEGA